MRVPRGQNDRSGARFAGGRGNIRTGCGACDPSRLIPSSCRDAVFHHDDGIGALGHRRSGHDFDRFSAARRRLRIARRRALRR